MNAIARHLDGCEGTQQPGRCAPAALGRTSAYTLVELLVVIAIIAAVLGLVVPGATSMWRQRNEASTATLVRGLLESARTQAIRSGERGLFFFVDNDGVQRIAFIEGVPPTPCETEVCLTGTPGSECPIDTPCVTERMAVNRFFVPETQIYSVPRPYRVAARWAIESTANGTIPAWPQILESRWALARAADTPRYHRNFFTVIFNRQGQLVVGREVLISDPGRTGLRVDSAADYWQPGSPPQSADLDPENSSNELPGLIVLEDDRAANFVSVDGLIVYDDSVVNGMERAEDIWRFLLDEGIPLYVSRHTGDVIRGSKGGQ